MRPAALVFDFDGLICDTETLEYESVRRVFVDHGTELALSEWLPAVGLAEPPDWRNAREALAEVRADIEQGADMGPGTATV